MNHKKELLRSLWVNPSRAEAPMITGPWLRVGAWSVFKSFGGGGGGTQTSGLPRPKAQKGPK